MVNPQDNSHTVTGWGLVLPNGDVVWHHYKGHDLNTAKGRSALLLALTATSQDLSFPTKNFLERYNWTTRIENITVVCSEPTSVMPVTDQSAFGPPVTKPEGDSDGDLSSDSCDSGAVQQGSVGSGS